MMKIQRKMKPVLFVFLSLLLTLVGCSSSPTSSNSTQTTQTNQGQQGGQKTDEPKAQESGPKKGGELIIGFSTDASSLDPLLGNSGFDHIMLYNMFDTLVNWNNNLEPQPGLAKSWDTPDEKTIVFHLQEGVKFHDGTSFDAEVVKFNIERANSAESRVSDLKNVESVEVVDPLTVKLNLKQPDSSVILALSDRTGMMASPTAVKKFGADFAQNPVGSGPYKYVKWIPNGEVQMERFDGYWKKDFAHLDKITFKAMPDENTRINALKSGQINFIYPITTSNIPILEKDPNVVLSSNPQIASHQMYINVSKPPLDNKKIRQAILYAIDREALNKAITFGLGEPSHQQFPEGYWAHSSEVRIPYNPEKSRQLLKEAGVDKVKIDIVYQPAGIYTRLVEAVRGQLAEVGIEANILQMELTKGVSEYFNEKRYNIGFWPWTGRPDPQMTVQLLWSEKGYFNAAHKPNPELEALIAKSAATYEPAERAKIIGEVLKFAILEEAMSVPVLFEPSTVAMSPKVKGYEGNLLGKPKLASLWLDQ